MQAMEFAIYRAKAQSQGSVGCPSFLGFCSFEIHPSVQEVVALLIVCTLLVCAALYPTG